MRDVLVTFTRLLEGSRTKEWVDQGNGGGGFKNECVPSCSSYYSPTSSDAAAQRGKETSTLRRPTARYS